MPVENNKPTCIRVSCKHIPAVKCKTEVTQNSNVGQQPLHKWTDTMISVWFSITVTAQCASFIRSLYLSSSLHGYVSLLTVTVLLEINHGLFLHCYALVCEENMVVGGCFFAVYVCVCVCIMFNCDVLIGCSSQVIGSPLAVVLR